MNKNQHIHDCSGHNHMAKDIENNTGNRILLTLVLNLIIPGVQVVGGLYAHSMALISDATHNFSDFTAVLFTYIAFFVSKKGASPCNTFGYKRFEVLTAIINTAILLGAAAIIVYEAICRFFSPEPVSGEIVMFIAGIGILGNGFSAWLLHKDAKDSLNIRSAFLHMMGDMLTSVAVLISGAIFIFKPWFWLDPVFSILIVLFILKNCWDVLKEAGLILMNATPKDIDIIKLKESIEQIPKVCGVHYLHSWNISSSSIAFLAHIVVDDQPLSKTEIIAENIREKLLNQYGIDHVTLQFETARCGEGGLLCEMSCST